MATARQSLLRVARQHASWTSLAGPDRQVSTISAAVAAETARRSLGSVELPRDVTDAVNQAAKGVSRKLLRGKGMELTEELKQMTRSRHRGGVQPNFAGDEPATAPARPRRGKLRQQQRAQLQDLTSFEVFVGEGEGAAVAALKRGGRHGRAAVAAREAAENAEDERQLAAAGVHAMDDDVGVAGDEAGMESGSSSSLSTTENGKPPIDVIAASYRAPADALPAEVPRRKTSAESADARYDEQAALAYAATRMPGCYAALRAVLDEVARRRGPGWAPATVLDFGAGPGTATWAAQETWPDVALRVTAVDAAGAMAWLGRRVQAAREARFEEAAADDLVTAGYVLCELSDDGERQRLVARLWEATAPGGVLVLVEPGTPSGSRAVQAARAQLLGLEFHHEEAGRTSIAAAPSLGHGHDHKAKPEAHVLAPCPHDGPCPLLGRRTWCHFEQRFHRAALQRTAKNFNPMEVQVRDHADERYSYVAVAKAPRPVPAPQPVVDAAIPLGEDLLEILRSLPPEDVPRRARAQLGLEPLETGSKVPAESAEPSSSPSTPSAWGDIDDAFLLQLAQRRGALDGLDEATRALILESIRDGQEDDNGGDIDGLLRNFEAVDELDTISADGSSYAQGSWGNEVGSAQGLEASLEVNTDTGASSDDMGDEEANGMRQELGSNDDRHPSEGLTSANEPREGQEATAQLASLSWSRVLRPPIKRGGHVVIDLCAAAAGGARGEAVRQIVSRLGSERELGGRAAYRLARGLRWGDLWPAGYQARLPLLQRRDGVK